MSVPSPAPKLEARGQSEETLTRTVHKLDATLDAAGVEFTNANAPGAGLRAKPKG